MISLVELEIVPIGNHRSKCLAQNEPDFGSINSSFSLSQTVRRKVIVFVSACIGISQSLIVPMSRDVLQPMRIHLS